MTSSPINNDEILFNHIFSVESLLGEYLTKFKNTTSKGVDRINGFQFESIAHSSLATASKKCIDGTYKFTPYLELLKLKGRSKAPRIVGIPSIRDRIILSKINQYLASIFPERVPKKIASAYVRELSEDLKKIHLKDIWICSTDIKTFYDDISREILINVISERITHPPAISLIKRALSTPIVPKNTNRSNRNNYKTHAGVPQGLAISNILASIYMKDIDEEIPKLGVKYYRYVDDILMYGAQKEIESSFDILEEKLRAKELHVHPKGSEKTKIHELSQEFGYLGYIFNGDEISVRESSREKFLQTIASRFSDFSHNSNKRLGKFKYLNDQKIKDIFLEELNDRITGAFNKGKRYGWIGYYNLITDQSLLYRMDKSIEAMFTRLSAFNNKPPSELKKLSRSHWEIKFNPQGGYIRDYDAITTLLQKHNFLISRGRADPDEALSDEQIDDRYSKYVQKTLSSMHADEGSGYH
ncbi:reverse transcriptase domain-containing protein [Comamonas thiooxydans]|uniref:reverse transcriptase domain-containing protein n=1 Tax=Comamonas thiooxydans TaxID=363952 RepID=UPI0009B82E8B|nr:reverse transcriptase domain-containing protein [Comamonas thiooxydans]